MENSQNEIVESSKDQVEKDQDEIEMEVEEKEKEGDETDALEVEERESLEAEAIGGGGGGGGGEEEVVVSEKTHQDLEEKILAKVEEKMQETNEKVRLFEQQIQHLQLQIQQLQQQIQPQFQFQNISQQLTIQTPKKSVSQLHEGQLQQPQQQQHENQTTQKHLEIKSNLQDINIQNMTDSTSKSSSKKNKGRERSEETNEPSPKRVAISTTPVDLPINLAKTVLECKKKITSIKEEKGNWSDNIFLVIDEFMKNFDKGEEFSKGGNVLCPFENCIGDRGKKTERFFTDDKQKMKLHIIRYFVKSSKGVILKFIEDRGFLPAPKLPFQKIHDLKKKINITEENTEVMIQPKIISDSTKFSIIFKSNPLEKEQYQVCLSDKQENGVSIKIDSKKINTNTLKKTQDLDFVMKDIHTDKKFIDFLARVDEIKFDASVEITWVRKDVLTALQTLWKLGFKADYETWPKEVAAWKELSKEERHEKIQEATKGSIIIGEVKRIGDLIMENFEYDDIYEALDRVNLSHFCWKYKDSETLMFFIEHFYDLINDNLLTTRTNINLSTLTQEKNTEDDSLDIDAESILKNSPIPESKSHHRKFPIQLEEMVASCDDKILLAADIKEKWNHNVFSIIESFSQDLHKGGIFKKSHHLLCPFRTCPLPTKDKRGERFFSDDKNRMKIHVIRHFIDSAKQVISDLLNKVQLDQKDHEIIFQRYLESKKSPRTSDGENDLDYDVMNTPKVITNGSVISIMFNPKLITVAKETLTLSFIERSEQVLIFSANVEKSKDKDQIDFEVKGIETEKKIIDFEIKIEDLSFRSGLQILWVQPEIFISLENLWKMGYRGDIKEWQREVFEWSTQKQERRIMKIAEYS